MGRDGRAARLERRPSGPTAEPQTAPCQWPRGGAQPMTLCVFPTVLSSVVTQARVRSELGGRSFLLP